MDRKSALLVPFTLLVLALFANAQKNSPANFDAADFARKFAIAEWLVEYDAVAWKTTDVVLRQDASELARLGPEWFCFQDAKGLWHAVYGKFENDKYTVVFHLTMTADQKITLIKDAVDQEFLNGHARALVTARAHLENLTKDRDMPRFNQYVRLNADKSYSVWMLPAFQPDGTAVYGGEAIYTISADGKKILKDESYFQKTFRGFRSKPPREIWLDFSELEKPTLGAIFFVWYYKSYFTAIFIDNAKTTSTVVGMKQNTPLWVHVEKPKEEDSKKPVKP